jgi:probable biosynthetic protein (TIGR04098 family)
VSEHGERLYGSVIDTELCFADGYGQERLGEDAEVHVCNRVRFFAKKFVEGLFLIDDKPIPASILGKVERTEDLAATGLSWGRMTNAFIARAGGNVRLKVYKPAGADELDIPELKQPPFGIGEQGRVQASGEIQPLDEGDEFGIDVLPVRAEPILYEIVPESDLNGAGLVYFARYEAMMNYGERVLLMDRLAQPLSRDFVAHLSTEHRKVFFFANASPSDRVEIHAHARLVPRGAFPNPTVGGGYRVPLKMIFRIDLYRCSDKMLMASSLVRKSLNVPGNVKAVLNEAERLLRRYT